MIDHSHHSPRWRAEVLGRSDPLADAIANERARRDTLVPTFIRLVTKANDRELRYARYQVEQRQVDEFRRDFEIVHGLDPRTDEGREILRRGLRRRFPEGDAIAPAVEMVEGVSFCRVTGNPSAFWIDGVSPWSILVEVIGDRANFRPEEIGRAIMRNMATMTQTCGEHEVDIFGPIRFDWHPLDAVPEDLAREMVERPMARDLIDRLHDVFQREIQRTGIIPFDNAGISRVEALLRREIEDSHDFAPGTTIRIPRNPSPGDVRQGVMRGFEIVVPGAGDYARRETIEVTLLGQIAGVRLDETSTAEE